MSYDTDNGSGVARISVRGGVFGKYWLSVMYIRWFDMLFDIIAIISQGPNSQMENFRNRKSWEGINRPTPFVYVPGWRLELKPASQ